MHTRIADIAGFAVFSDGVAPLRGQSGRSEDCSEARGVHFIRVGLPYHDVGIQLRRGSRRPQAHHRHTCVFGVVVRVVVSVEVQDESQRTHSRAFCTLHNIHGGAVVALINA